MRIGDEEAYVEFEFMEAVSKQPGTFDAACSVEVRCGDFRGRVEGIWFENHFMRAFLDDLDKLPRDRGSSASLFNLYSWTSFDPLRFEISSQEGAEDLVVSADLSRAVDIGERSHALKVSVAFPVDGLDLRAVREDFHKLFYGYSART